MLWDVTRSVAELVFVGGCHDERSAAVVAEMIVDRLRSIPVEQRMKAMGMEPATSWGTPVVVTHYDGREQHNRSAWVEVCDEPDDREPIFVVPEGPHPPGPAPLPQCRSCRRVPMDVLQRGHAQRCEFR